jgi:gamma-glutamylcyclotransferase (GGCT)/AIG2-like uncharacterized protein YtfP
MNKEKLLICVYGSLRKGMGNHRLLETSKLLSTETIQDNFRMVDMGSYPGLIESEEANDIIIEIYEVTPETYKRIEMLESYPSFYDRKNVHTTEGEVGIYYLPKNSGWTNSGRIVDMFDGAFDWVKHYQQKRFKYA